MNSKKIRVRFPPSPTGPMHIGTARAMLFNFLFAKNRGGEIVFRSEDTDRIRSKPEFEKEILDGLAWLGLTFDEGPFHQSDREEIYEKYFEKLKESGAIYPCFCSAEDLEKENAERAKKKLPPRYSGRCRDCSREEAGQKIAAGEKPVWRFRVPEGEIKFHDLVRGDIREDGKNIGDFVVRKSDGQFLYHFVVVVDDIEMAISHVIRGEDHISNTSKHVLLFNAFGSPLPEFAHLPLLLNRDRSKMSKRDESGRPLTLARLKEDGYLPAAVVNFLALLGWHPGDEREFFTLAELEKEFSLDRVAKAGAVCELDRLDFFNSKYIRELPADELLANIRDRLDFDFDEEILAKAVPLISERLKNFAEAPAKLKFFFELPEYDAAELFPHEKMKVDLAAAKNSLEAALPVLEKIAESEWTAEKIQTELLAEVEARTWKNGQLLWPVRVALTGEKFSPGVWEVAFCLGREESLRRVRLGIDKLAKVA